MRNQENCSFICKHCGKKVLPLTNGSYRNHCPFCLYSLHVDDLPGDRQSQCHGLMAPINYRYHSKKGYQIKHKCIECGKEQWNKVAEDTVQEDLFVEWLTNNLNESPVNSAKLLKFKFQQLKHRKAIC